MRRIFLFFSRNLKKTRIVLLFVLTTVLILLLFPREGRFGLEFQKGAPWMHDELIAPFNFPIYKYDTEIAAERDSILREFKPYFIIDMEIGNLQYGRFLEVFDEKWKEFFTAGNGGSGNPHYRGSRSDRVRTRYLLFAGEILRFVYAKGIIGNEDVLHRVDNKDLTIVLLEDKYAEERGYGEVFTQKMAYEYVLDRLSDFRDSLYTESDIDFFRSLNISEFLVPNLFYDETTSNQVKDELLEGLSLTRGMVQSGERIISRGELVTPEKYRILESLRREYNRNLGLVGAFNYIFLGKMILVIIPMILLYLFLYNFRTEVLQSPREVTFLLLLLLIMVAVSSFTINFNVLSIYFLPFAIVPIMVRTFFDSRMALFIHIIIVMIVGFWAPNSYEFIFLNLIAGIVAILTLTNSYRRGILFLTGVMVVAAYSAVYLAFSMIQEGNLLAINFKAFLWFAGNGLLILTVYPLIFIFEKTFKFLSDSTLIELSDTNQPLLRELAEKAPGTFQHSLQVANLAEEAVIQVGGSPLLVRTGALYHDIGKMYNPEYFVENQSTGYNAHDELTFEDSARIIINHVMDGVEIAKKYRLPEAIVDFIRTHHGTSIVQYFYRSFLKEFPEDESSRHKFVYPGPRPFSKETAVLMMADSVEATSRSLQVKDRANLSHMVEEIIDQQIREQQFDNTDITFRDIDLIKEIFLRKLLNIYHVRIEYPI
jgi:putative nucleotidyltransferase with HDIG domain